MPLFAAFDIDQPFPVVPPLLPPTADGVMMQSDQRLDRFIGVAIKRKDNNLAELCERYAYRSRFRE
jgi:hypothetical protein